MDLISMMKKEKVFVLLIEKCASDVKLLREWLNAARPAKYEIEATDTLDKGIRLLKKNNYDIVLTDLSLPDADSHNAVAIIQEVNHAIPVIVLSDQDSNEMALQVVQMGAQDYIVKGQGDGHLISRAIEYSIERKRIEQGLIYISQHDGLTGLANRSLFRERFSRALIRAERNNTLVALLFIDLDRFKNINDTLGHDAGDQLLVEVGKRLKNCTREGDTIARLGGDEFTIVLEDLKNVDDSAKIAQKIIDVMHNPFDMEGYEVFVTPSIGITVFPVDAKNEHTLLKNADTAMYRAKEIGKNGFQFYTADMNTRSLERLGIEAKLRRALDNDELELYYQPKINIKTREIVGAEALLRWQQPDMGMVSPAVFIPIAEETGLIEPIGDWVVRMACKQNAYWQSEGYGPIRMAVNLSVRQFRQADFVSSIFDALIRADLLPEYLEVEITESMLMDDTARSNMIIKALKEGGIQAAIDDFGTGYSSLSYLKRFKIDTLKIDQSFVRDITIDPDDASIVSAIIAMGRSLRMNVIAEGVETIEQLNFLARHGCNEAQGYYFGRPVPAYEFVKLLKKTSSPREHLRLIRSV